MYEVYFLKNENHHTLDFNQLSYNLRRQDYYETCNSYLYNI